MIQMPGWTGLSQSQFQKIKSEFSHIQPVENPESQNQSHSQSCCSQVQKPETNQLWKHRQCLRNLWVCNLISKATLSLRQLLSNKTCRGPIAKPCAKCSIMCKIRSESFSFDLCSCLYGSCLAHPRRSVCCIHGEGFKHQFGEVAWIILQSQNTSQNWHAQVDELQIRVQERTCPQATSCSKGKGEKDPWQTSSFAKSYTEEAEGTSTSLDLWLH